MHRWITPILLLVGCSGDDPEPKGSPTATSDTDTDTDVDTDTDTDTDADTDTVTDTGWDPDAAYLRVLHASRGLGPIDMVVNGNLPPVLPSLGPTDGTEWTSRVPNTYTFQFRGAGDPLEDAFLTEDHELEAGVLYSYVVYGPSDAPLLATFEDDDQGIGNDEVRVRWSHFATTLPTLDLLETASGDSLVTELSFGDSTVQTYPRGRWSAGLDTDLDGIADVLFEDFTLTAGTLVHIVLLEDLSDTPFLLAHQPAGTTARKDVVGE